MSICIKVTTFFILQDWGDKGEREGQTKGY